MRLPTDTAYCFNYALRLLMCMVLVSGAVLLLIAIVGCQLPLLMHRVYLMVKFMV